MIPITKGSQQRREFNRIMKPAISDVGKAIIFNSLSTEDKEKYLTPKSKFFILNKFQALKFQVPFNRTIQCILKSGSANICGTPLVINKPYYFTGTNKFISTFLTAVLSIVQWPIQVPNQSSKASLNLWWSKIGSQPLDNFETVDVSHYLTNIKNIHAHLEVARLKSKQFFLKNNILFSQQLIENLDSGLAVDTKSGPKCMIIGPTDVGKSTLCKFLLNYAVGSGFKPSFVDLDIGQSVLHQGIITGSIINSLIKISRVGDESPSLSDSVSYFYGNLSPDANISFYSFQCSNLQHALKERSRRDLINLYSGSIINTCGWVTPKGCLLIEHLISIFQPIYLIVIGSNDLYKHFNIKFPLIKTFFY